MEYGTRTRILRILMSLIDHPYHYTKAQLAQRYNVSSETIKGDLENIKNAGFVLDFDKNYRYALEENKGYKQLRDLLHFSEEEQLLLEEAIDQVGGSHSKRAERLKKKLSSLYDFSRLGHAYLRKPYLTKLDLLKNAKQNKKAICLIDYKSSNSNNVQDREVEAFHFNAAEDILHAFDYSKKALRHFRISRIKRIQILEQDWQYEGHHQVSATDPFRIVDNQQVNVHLRLKVGAYNELIERFPLTQAYIQHDGDEDVYDFQASVNHRFFGLTNFILGHHHQLVEIVSPSILLDHLAEEIKKMQENLGVGK